MSQKRLHYLHFQITAQYFGGIKMIEAKVAETSADTLLDLSSKIVIAYVGNNSTNSKSLPDIISSVYTKLKELQNNGVSTSSPPSKPAVPIKKSITDEYIICLEDGKKLKMMKRYLRSRYNLSPQEYRIKWGLAPDYPMVSPNYAAKRSDFAKKNGLGKKSK